MLQAYEVDGKKYQPRDEISWRDIDGELVAVDTISGEYHVFNATGRVLWLAITESATVGQAIQRVTRSFESDPRTVEEDMRKFIHDLHQKSLLKTV